MTISFQKAISIYTTSLPAKIAGICLYFIVFTFSCKNPQKVSLERQISENPAGVFYTDTFTVNTETVAFENLSTKNKPHILVGNYFDAEFGQISTKSFANMVMDGPDSLQFDVIEDVVIKMDFGFVIGDTLKPLTIDFYELKNSVDSLKDYDRSSPDQEVNAAPVGSITFKYKDGITTHSSPGLKEYFKKHSSLKQPEKFSSFFKGLEFRSSDNSFCVGLRTGKKAFTISVSGDGYPPREIYISEKSTRYSKATGDVDDVIKNKNSQFAHINEILGVGAKITVQGIKTFLEKIKGQYVVTNAEFVIPSAFGFQQDIIRPYVFIYETDTNGNRFKVNKAYKIVQEEFPGDSRFITSLDSTNNGLIRSYNNQSSSYNSITYTRYLKEIASGQRANNSLIFSEVSTTRNGTCTQTPLTYSFLKGTAGGNKIRFVVRYNKMSL